MKHLLLTTIAAVVLVGCGESPNELLHQAVIDGNIEAVKQHIAAGADVNAKEEKYSFVGTPLDLAIQLKRTETADRLRKHGGKTGEGLKAEGK
jgi:ankyrin repeat protein